MATKKDKEKKEVVPVVVPVPPKTLVLEGDPDTQLAFAMKAANALMNAVGQKKNKVMIRGEQYLEYGDWQTLARFFGATASVAWSKKLLNDKNEFVGYEARAEVLHNGVVISAAEAMCMRNERNWKDRDEFMLRSMAQTRASAKALRNAYGWVAELAGMKATPAEEMDGVAGYDHGPIKDDAVPVVVGADEIQIDEGAPISREVAERLGYGPQMVPKPTVASLKKEIRVIADEQADVPLMNAKDYIAWVFAWTKLDLKDQSADNLLAIVKTLKVKFDLTDE